MNKKIVKIFIFIFAILAVILPVKKVHALDMGNIELGKSLQGEITNSNTKDTYKFTLSSKQTLRLNLGTNLSSVNVNFKDSKGQNIVKFDKFLYTGLAQYSYIYNITLEPGTYYLSFEQSSNANGQYKFILSSPKGWVKNFEGEWSYYDIVTQKMSTDWGYINGKWYHFTYHGIMEKGFITTREGWYYVGQDGTMKTGWQFVNNKWFYFQENGLVKHGWLKWKNLWYYLGDFGITEGWKVIDGKWYYFSTGGNMATNWVKSNNKWYFLDGSGAMKTGWVLSNSKWYYLYEDGHMAYSTTIGNYKLGTDGALIK